MNQLPPANELETMAQLGEAKLVCRTSRKTLFWGFLVASLIASCGTGVLIAPFTIFMADSPMAVLQNCLFFLPIGGLLLWGGTYVCSKTNRKRYVQVVVHAGGVTYRNDKISVTYLWDQIDGRGWQVWDHHDEGVARVGGVPIYANSTHITHRLTVRLKDGAELIFTDELDDVEALVTAIQQGLGRNTG